MADSPIQVLVTHREPIADGPISSTRIDAPHPPAGNHAASPIAAGTIDVSAASTFAEEAVEQEPEGNILAAIAGIAAADQAAELQSHADELAEQLRERQLELDRRESSLHSQLARQEQNLRASRLWVQERELTLRAQEAELQERATAIAQEAASLETRGIATEESLQSLRRALEQRRQELDERESRLSTRETGCQDHVVTTFSDASPTTAEILREERRRLEQEHVRRLAQLEEARQEFDSRRAEHDACHAAAMEQVRQQAEQLDSQRAKWESQQSGQRATSDTLARREAELQSRIARVSQQETKLAQAQAELDRTIQQKEAERAAADQARLDRQSRDDDQRRTRDREQRERQQRQDQQAADLAAREQALESLQSEVAKVHREALEMRLVVEQLWAQLTGRATPHQLSDGLQEVRQQVADHFRAREKILAEQRLEMERLASRLESQEARLREQHAAQQDWLLARRTELANLADVLAQKELDLDDAAQSLADRSGRRRPRTMAAS